MARCSRASKRTTASTRTVLLALWGIESAYGDPDVQKNAHAAGVPGARRARLGRAAPPQVLGAGAAQRAASSSSAAGATPEEMRGSWAGAMGHTQWMPEVWLNVGIGLRRRRPRLAVRQARRRARRRPRAISSSAASIARGEHWGYEVTRAGQRGGERVAQLRGLAEGRRHPRRRPAVPAARSATAKLWVPVPGGPAFLLGPNFYAVRSLQPVDELHAVDRAPRRP